MKLYQNKYIARDLGITDWTLIVEAMHSFINHYTKSSIEEIWFTEHYSIFTQGPKHNSKHIINLNNIPIKCSDRGGNVTYHAPGQQIIYFLLNLKQRQLYPKKLIFLIEQLVINTLEIFSIIGYRIDTLPGVYVCDKKICSIALRIKNGLSLHGLALNVNMDLLPFNYIYPCGNTNMKMTMMSCYNNNVTMDSVKIVLLDQLSVFFMR
ncbi:MAG: lipoyl(octanoyl) transferase LipB [Buchnera aphidicola (Eriosoma harunire)]